MLGVVWAICLISVISLSVPIIGAMVLTAAGKGLVDE
jgi:hypothetical protein